MANITRATRREKGRIAPCASHRRESESPFITPVWSSLANSQTQNPHLRASSNHFVCQRPANNPIPSSTTGRSPTRSSGDHSFIPSFLAAMGGGGGGGEATAAETAIASTIPTATAMGAGTTTEGDDAVAGIKPGQPPALHVIVLVRFLFLGHLHASLPFTLVLFIFPSLHISFPSFLCTSQFALENTPYLSHFAPTCVGDATTDWVQSCSLIVEVLDSRWSHFRPCLIPKYMHQTRPPSRDRQHQCIACLQKYRGNASHHIAQHDKGQSIPPRHHYIQANQDNVETRSIPVAASFTETSRNDRMTSSPAKASQGREHRASRTRSSASSRAFVLSLLCFFCPSIITCPTLYCCIGSCYKYDM